MPDADLEVSSKIIADSVYGCAGQRCLAASNIITVGDERGLIKESIYQSALTKTTGFGLDEGIEMGPVISAESKKRIENLIQSGEKEGAKILLDGRSHKVSGYENGNFLAPTILENVPTKGELVNTEIFGPVMSMISMKTMEDAIQFINANRYGNMACLFTSGGAAARKFRTEVNSGNVGINIGVAAPMAQFPFSGWNESFFGDLHAQGRHGIEFYTQTKVVIESWPKHWSRKF